MGVRGCSFATTLFVNQPSFKSTSNHPDPATPTFNTPPPKGVKAKREKLFGFGHRVYKNFDPRAVIIRKVGGWGRCRCRFGV
jgi:hypothetical protein